MKIEDLPGMWTAYSQRWSERDDRMSLMADVIAGDWGLVADDGLEVENRSPNLIQVGVEDTAEAAAYVPSTRVDPSGSTKRKQEQADAMERMAVGYWDRSNMELLNVHNMLDLAAYGFFVNVAVMDERTGTPYAQRRDPRTCFPEPGWSPMDTTKRVMFAREVYLTQLPEEWQWKFHQDEATPAPTDALWQRDYKVTLVEFYDDTEYVVGGLYRSNNVHPGGNTRSYAPVEFHREDHEIGECPVVVGQRITLDGDPRGQFDQAINVMAAHIRLMGTVMDYADQSIYSDVWVKDLIGEMSVGGGGYIQLGPNGAIGRVAPAVTNFSVYEQLSQLVDGVHLGGRWPKTRPGDIDQAIASGKFLETSAAMMNTAIRTMHLIAKRAYERLLSIMFKLDAAKGRDRVVTGVLSNQKFRYERRLGDIDLNARIRVEYGAALGRDQAQATVMGIQMGQAGLVSNEFVQENIEGITDVAKERSRIDVEKLRDMAFARLMQGLESGEVPLKALTEIAKARAAGAQIIELFDEYLVKPQEEMQAQQLTSGLTGEAMMPGLPPMPGAMPPAPPGPEELLGGELATIGRTSVPLGNGSFAGVESRG